MQVNARFLNEAMLALTTFFDLDLGEREEGPDGLPTVSTATRAVLRQAKAMGRCCVELSPQDRPPGSNPRYLTLDGRHMETAPVWHEYVEKRGRGRGASTQQLRSRPRAVSADDETWAALKELGQGNVSLGIRVALAAAQSLAAEGPVAEALDNPVAPSRWLPPGPLTPELRAEAAQVIAGPQLRALRMTHGLKQRECAELSGVATDTWKQLEYHGGGKRRIDPDMVARFLQRTGWTPPAKEDMSDLLG